MLDYRSVPFARKSVLISFLRPNQVDTIDLDSLDAGGSLRKMVLQFLDGKTGLNKNNLFLFV